MEDVFPDSRHVKDLDMARASDTAIWKHAREEGFTIISKDSDFHQRSFVLGSPPKVIWIQRGNCTTDEIYRLLYNHRDSIEAFGYNKESSFLVLE